MVAAAGVIQVTTSSEPHVELPPPGSHLADGDIGMRVYSCARLPARHGTFALLVVRQEPHRLEHVVLVRGAVAGRQRVSTRVHSECLTGDALGSLRCDCRDQLEMSLAALGGQEHGILLYMRQEGRGIGLGDKIRAYALQEAGLDTFAANRCLGFADDPRDWRPAALILRLLGVGSIVLLTNNPEKLRGLAEHGITIAGRQGLEAESNPHNIDYLRAKVTCAGHALHLPAAAAERGE